MKRRKVLFSVDDYQMEYTLVGEGAPILVFHGGHSNCMETFGYEFLVENSFMIITPSRAGYGKISKEIGVNLNVACQYYVELLNHLHVDKAHIIAISAGGPTGICFSANYPDRVKTLTLQSAVTKEWLTPQDTNYKIANVIFRPPVEKYTWAMFSIMSRAFPTFIFKQMIPSFSKLSYPEVKEKMEDTDVIEVCKMNHRQRSGQGFLLDLKQNSELSKEVLQQITCPTHVMHSLHDSSVPIEHAHFAQEYISFSSLTVLDSWGHLIWLGKDSRETNQKVTYFLQEYQ
ncbi:alpha/beta fold hydrolase [Oceanobacillus halophilus]|uniref:Alpha/beta hydrolase n=1 Tax=Oceanobacillus halophilus TaxID=930130 RepID=A0A495A560_9BACI|nr:alpha/beta hydrolase [Oceanobacillus halophilus]RKQ34673.1 alpha/beta hydrolase [Oceanobacillus halophilus]